MTARGEGLGVLVERGLTAERVIRRSDRNLVVRCRDAQGNLFVVKQRLGTSAHARRALRKEVAAIRDLAPAGAMLRFPRYVAHGDDHLVTGFESGASLCERMPYDDDLARRIADALLCLQSTGAERVRRSGISDAMGLERYYLRLLAKHLLHVWPDLVAWRDVARSMAVVLRSLPVLRSNPVLCHGDFHCGNILQSAEDDGIVLLDFESLLAANHALFDAVSFCTDNDLPILEWSWQRAFFRHYLAGAAGRLALDWRDAAFERAYRGILIVFLVYRISERRSAILQTGYFDGAGKARFVLRRARRASAARDAERGLKKRDERLATRIRNLSLMLEQGAFERHYRWLFGGADGR